MLNGLPNAGQGVGGECVDEEGAEFLVLGIVGDGNRCPDDLMSADLSGKDVLVLAVGLDSGGHGQDPSMLVCFGFKGGALDVEEDLCCVRCVKLPG